MWTEWVQEELQRKYQSDIQRDGREIWDRNRAPHQILDRKNYSYTLICIPMDRFKYRQEQNSWKSRTVILGKGQCCPYTFVNSTLQGGKWSTLSLDHFTLWGKSPQFPLSRRISGPQRWPACVVGGEKNFLSHEFSPNHPAHSQSPYWHSYDTK